MRPVKAELQNSLLDKKESRKAKTNRDTNY